MGFKGIVEIHLATPEQFGWYVRFIRKIERI